MSDSVSSSSAIGDSVIAIWSEILGEKISLQTNILESGANSIHLLLALNRIQQELKTELDASVFFDHPVVGDFVNSYLLDISDDADEFFL